MSRKIMYGLLAAGAIAGGAVYGIGKMRAAESDLPPAGVASRPGAAGVGVPPMRSGSPDPASPAAAAPGAASPAGYLPASPANARAKAGPPPVPPKDPTPAAMKAYRAEVDAWRRRVAEAEGKLAEFEKAESERKAKQASREARREERNRMREAVRERQRKDRAAKAGGRLGPPDPSKFPDVAVRVPDSSPPR